MIVTKSRYGDFRYIEELDDNSYLIYGKSNYMRISDDFIDYEGGPFIAKDEKLHSDDERVIVGIHPYLTRDKDNCYKITVV